MLREGDQAIFWIHFVSIYNDLIVGTIERNLRLRSTARMVTMPGTLILIPSPVIPIDSIYSNAFRIYIEQL